jgi:D-sorbitol dehydrogenase (acceptor)
VRIDPAINLEGKVCLVAVANGGIGAAAVNGLFAKFEGKPKEQKKKEVGDAAPLGIMRSPTEAARVAVFLASKQSQCMTATTLSATGGNVLR